MERTNQLENLLGCTDLEKEILEDLRGGGRRTVLEIARAIQRPRESVNRSVNNLQRKNLVQVIPGWPRHFYAVPIDLVTQALFGSLAPAIAGVEGEAADVKLPISFIHNRETHHRVGMELFDQSKKEVMTIASGRGDLHPDYYKIMVRKIKKGLRYRVLALHCDEENHELLENWKKNGFEVRYLAGEDVNVIVYDRKIVQFGLRMLEGSREKSGVIIRNESFGGFMGDYFDFLWEKGEEV